MDTYKPGPTGKFTPKEAKQAKRLSIVLGIIAFFFVFELGGAYLARSRVLQTDALHLLMDVLGLGVSLVAMRVAVLRPTHRFTYGLRRAEPVAALINALLVLAATVEMVGKSWLALEGHETPDATIMLVVAVVALVINGISVALIHGTIDQKGHAHHHPHGGNHGGECAGEHHGVGHALNMRGARLHLLGDMLGSLAAIAAALVIRLGGPTKVDAAGSLVVAVILLVGVLRLARDAVLVLLEASPSHLQVDAIRTIVATFPTVEEVHDLHVWTLGAGHDAITVHVRADGSDTLLAQRVSTRLREVYSVEYVTVQVESPEEVCKAPTLEA